MRTVLGVALATGGFNSKLTLERAARQDRVPTEDVRGATGGFTLLNLSMLYTLKSGSINTTFFLRGNNLTNRAAFNASSIDSIRGLAPVPGRSIKGGVRVEF